MPTIPQLAEQLQDDVRGLLSQYNFKSHKDHSRWTLHSPNLYVRGVNRKYIEGVNLNEKIAELQSYKDLTYALPGDDVYKKRLDKIISTHSQSGTINAETYIKLVLVNEGNLLLQKPYQAKKAKEEFLKELTTDDYTVRLVTPILGLKVGGKISLGQNTKIIPQNDEDVIKCLDWGLLDTSFPNDGTYWIHSNHTGISFLISEYKHPIVSGRQINEAERKTYNEFDDKHEWFKNSLQMAFDVHNYEINVGKTIVTANYLAVPGERILDLEATPQPWAFSRNLILKRSLGKELKSTFNLLNDKRNKSNRMLRLASSRLALARHRKSDEDSFLDLMIACEAFYMSNEADHIDIGYKLRIRAATWYSGNEYTKGDIMKLFTLAYDVRSRIAHGSIPNKIKFRGNVLTRRELFGIIEKIFKAALLKYLKHLNKKPTTYVHDWEAVVTDS